MHFFGWGGGVVLKATAAAGDKDANDIPPIFGSMFGGGKVSWKKNLFDAEFVELTQLLLKLDVQNLKQQRIYITWMVVSGMFSESLIDSSYFATMLGIF